MASKLDILNEKSVNFPVLLVATKVNVSDETSRHLSALSEKYNTDRSFCCLYSTLHFSTSSPFYCSF